MPKKILGLSCFYHDSAAALLVDGKIVAAAQEERFTRKKHDDGFPRNAVEYCLKESGLKINEIDSVVFYDKPFLKFERILQTFLQYAPKGLRSYLAATPVWIKQKLWIRELIKDELNYDGKILFAEHHQSHGASAFFPSPYKKAAFLTVDGVGEWSTVSYGVGEENKMEIMGEMHFPHSLGLLYSAFTYYTGFKVNSGEYKVMGLAPYGEPKYKDLILNELMDLKEDGSFRLDMSYFNYCGGLTMTNKKFDKLFGGPPRKKETLITQREMDLARSVQAATEEIMMRLAKHVHKETGCDYLCLAGGVALNCVANGKVLREGPFKKIWIQPASGDAGSALGAALFAWYQYYDGQRHVDDINDLQAGSYLGPEYSEKEIQEYLEVHGIPYTKLAEKKMPKHVAELLANENVIGWFQGRMEFGPRALGARSILGDPRSTKMQETMNLKIKFRESFRPFAPSVLIDKVADYFSHDRESPYMLLVAPINSKIKKKMSDSEDKLFGIEKLNVVRSKLPAITHVDYSARIQTVDGKHNKAYYELLKSFEEDHGCPVVINTSFNVRGEPIVNTPDDAYRCFMRTNMDYLVLGNFLLDKKAQPAFLDSVDWQQEFELD